MFYVDDLLWAVFAYVTGWIGLISCLTYALVHLYQYFLKAQNLKAKYNADWALVTGASSGIGKAIVHRLAEQKINVVLVALDDEMFKNTFKEISSKYPDLQFRQCGVNLGQPGKYMGPIMEACQGIEPTLIFNNAGYIVPGFFADTDIEKITSNLECNATCSVYITHYFLQRMIAKKQKGYIAFTSSAGGYFPGPTATMYSSSKAFLTNFACTVAAECKDIGIDVCAMHPSPIASNFYAGVDKVLSTLQAAQKAAMSPDVIAEQLFAAAGRLTVWDQGNLCAIFRMVLKLVDFAFFAELVTRFSWVSGDFRKLAKSSKLRGGHAE